MGGGAAAADAGPHPHRHHRRRPDPAEGVARVLVVVEVRQERGQVDVAERLDRHARRLVVTGEPEAVRVGMRLEPWHGGLLVVLAGGPLWASPARRSSRPHLEVVARRWPAGRSPAGRPSRALRPDQHPPASSTTTWGTRAEQQRHQHRGRGQPPPPRPATSPSPWQAPRSSTLIPISPGRSCPAARPPTRSPCR